jgi:serine protease AprX
MSPLVIAVGATDPRGTITTTDDYIPWFAQHGSAARGVDIVAPGVSVISLKVPGSFVDQNTTTGRIGTRFQQASGTSQATAVVSGLAALLVSKYPTATPDQIKAHLKSTAKPMALIDPTYATTDLAKAFVTSTNTWYSGSGSAWVGGTSTITTAPTQTSTATGLGTLEAARGSFHVTNGTTELKGEIDIFGNKWNPTTMAALATTQTAWNGGTFNGARWSGDTWNGARWSSLDWTNTDWTGARWSGARWSSTIWDGARWSGARWSGARWSAGTWSGARWSGARWSDANWS